MKVTTKLDKIQLKAKQVESQQCWLDGSTQIAEPSSSSWKSWTDIVKEEVTASAKKEAIWDNFEVTKVVNAGFKLDYVKQTKQGENQCIEIGLDDISSEIEYRKTWGDKRVEFYHFDSKPFIVKAWTPDMEFSKDELRPVSIWIRLPGLDFKYWSQKGLTEIGSCCGETTNGG